jgi:hypothetical protein
MPAAPRMKARKDHKSAATSHDIAAQLQKKSKSAAALDGASKAKGAPAHALGKSASRAGKK